MNCPSCNAPNADDALRCTKCGFAFPVVDEAETLIGTSPSPSAPSAAGVTPRPSTAARLLTPPPRPGSGTPPSGGSLPSSWGPSLSLAPGSDFGARYRIEALIGEGGMGTVYKAFDKELDRVVALKLIRFALATDASALQRFKQELLLASKISHKNILRIHDLGDAEGMKFISMAFVEGEDLHQILKRDGRLPVARAVKIIKQLCGALEAATAEGVVHRDLKPHNILIDRNEQIYVTDFGLAKSLEAGAAGMTRTGEFLGTPRYMSPEQVEAKPIDHRSDLFALGLIFYEMVTGDVPFSGDSTIQVMFSRVKDRAKNPKLLNPELPDNIARIILRCLEKEPTRRYQHARDILADLEADRAPSAARSLRITVPMPDTRRGWLLAGGSIAVLALLAALAMPGVRDFVLRRSASSAGGSTGPVPAGQVKYVAVLPFRVLENEAGLGYVAEGLVEALSARLFQLREVRVASAAAVEKAAKKDSLDKIARDLGVGLIVQGTVRPAGEKIRIFLNLEDVAGGKRLWTQEFTGLPQDMLALEDQIYSQLVNALELKLSNEEMAKGTARRTDSVEAYDLYLKGRNAVRNQRDVKVIQGGIRFFEQALEKDPGFALAYAGLADASLVMYGLTNDQVWASRALGAAQQAERLNDKIAEVHFSLGSVLSATGKTAEAVAELKRALELAPNSDAGYGRLGAAYLASGRKDGALAAFQKAVDVNPYYWFNQSALGDAYLHFGENDKALAAYRRVTEIEPDNAGGYEKIGLAYFRQGKWNECIPAFQKSLEIHPYYSTYSNLGVAYFYLKRYPESGQMFEKAVELQPNDETAVGNLADAYRWSGQQGKAATTYDRAISLAFKDLQVNPRKASTLGSLALYYAKKGDPTQGLQFARRARAIDSANISLIYIEAVVHIRAGRVEESLRALREAFQKGYPPEEARNDPELTELHSRADFDQLVKEFVRKSK